MITEHWYAVLKDGEDYDWGYGSFDKADAISMATRLGNESLIATIKGDYDDNGDATTDPICVAIEKAIDLKGDI